MQTLQLQIANYKWQIVFRCSHRFCCVRDNGCWGVLIEGNNRWVRGKEHHNAVRQTCWNGRELHSACENKCTKQWVNKKFSGVPHLESRVKSKSLDLRSQVKSQAPGWVTLCDSCPHCPVCWYWHKNKTRSHVPKIIIARLLFNKIDLPLHD